MDCHRTYALFGYLGTGHNKLLTVLKEQYHLFHLILWHYLLNRENYQLSSKRNGSWKIRSFIFPQTWSILWFPPCFHQICGFQEKRWTNDWSRVPLPSLSQKNETPFLHFTSGTVNTLLSHFSNQKINQSQFLSPFIICCDFIIVIVDSKHPT